MEIPGIRQKTDRISLANKRLAAAYGRQVGEDVPVVEPRVPGGRHTHRECFNDVDKMLEHASVLAGNLAAIDNDWPPFIDTFNTIAMVPEAFGCEVAWVDELPWALHTVSDVAQVWNLKPKKPMDTPQIKRTFEWVDYCQRNLGVELPMWTMDIQSPFSVAAQIVEPTELLIACLTDAKAVHHICRMVTEYSIELMQMHIKQMEHPGFPGRNFPSISDSIGVCLADDTPLTMLSPEMYREFALPYNSMIGAAFGGVHIHSCGNYSANLDNLLDTTNIRSIQLHAGPGEFPLPETAEDDCAFNRARKRLAYFIDSHDVTRGDRYRGQHRRHYDEYVIPRLCAGDMTGCILQSSGCPESDLEHLDSNIHWTRNRLAALAIS